MIWNENCNSDRRIFRHGPGDGSTAGRFSELFDLPFEVVEISENGFKNEPVAQLLGNHAKKKWRKMADRFLE